MSDPRRYLDDERAEPFARALLQSASQDGLDDAALARMFDETARAAGGSTVARSASIFGRSKWGIFAILAVLAVGTGASVTFVGGHATRAPAAASAPPVRALAASVSAPPVAQVEPKTEAEIEAVPVALLPEVPSSARSLRVSHDPPARASAAAPPAAPDLAGEVRALERVRVAIAEQRVAAARADLASYERAFPAKLLGNEARVLEIEVLLADGRRDEAEVLARSFLASSSDSPYAARVRSLLASPRRP